MKSKHTVFENNKVSYLDMGKGSKTIVMLHGYLESKHIWHGFDVSLSDSYRVICIDLPGHGESDVSYAYSLTVEKMAGAVKAVLRAEGIKSCFMIGHSLGGYVTLAFLEHYPAMLEGYCLLHSSPFADTLQKRVMRDREIELVIAGRQKLLFAINIPSGFATDKLDEIPDLVSFAKDIAVSTKPDGVIAALEAMKCRPDRQNIMEESGKPLLVVLGKKDNYISHDIMASVAAGVPDCTLLTLETSGHNGFLEDPKTLEAGIRSFLKGIGL